MCIVSEDPISAVAQAVIGATVSMVSGIEIEKRERAVNEYNLQQTLQQAKNAERNAAYERQEGIEDARQKRLKAIQNMGSQKANIAAGNISVLSESSLNLIEDEKISGEIDALKIVDSSERKAQSYLDSAQQLYAQASLQSYKNKQNYDSYVSIIGNSLSSGLQTLTFMDF